jgi:hypothetical protein
MYSVRSSGHFLHCSCYVCSVLNLRTRSIHLSPACADVLMLVNSCHRYTDELQSLLHVRTHEYGTSNRATAM